MMKAQLIHTTGTPDVFTLSDVPLPTLVPGHVIIKVSATSVNQIDCKIRSGAVTAIAPAFPAILQGDVAGVITDVAPDVTHFHIGDEVYGCAGGLRGTAGALAEYMLADAALLAKKPRSLTMREAAALPLVSITAWEALFTRAHIKTNDRILIHGGVGGVGHIAVQLAAWAKANVATTILNDADVALATSLGARDVINAKNETVTEYVKRLTDGHGFDIIFDTVGGKNLDNAFHAAKMNGTVVTTAARSTHDLSPLHNNALSLHAVFMLLPLLTHTGRAAHGKILAQLATIIDEGHLKPLIDSHPFTLDTTPDAHAWLESGKARGKVVIDIK